MQKKKIRNFANSKMTKDDKGSQGHELKGKGGVKKDTNDQTRYKMQTPLTPPPKSMGRFNPLPNLNGYAESSGSIIL